MHVRELLFAAGLVAGISAAADTGRGVELFKQGKYDEAVTELRAAVAQKEDDAQANRYLGLALLEQNNFSDAERHIRRADELQPGGETKLALARLYVEQKKFDAAEAALKEAEGDDVQYVRGVLLVNKKQHEQAAQELESYLEKKPDNAYAHYYAGMAYSGLRRPDKMMSHFEQFLRMKPNAPEARKVRAVMQTGR